MKPFFPCPLPSLYDGLESVFGLLSFIPGLLWSLFSNLFDALWWFISSPLEAFWSCIINPFISCFYGVSSGESSTLPPKDVSTWISNAGHKVGPELGKVGPTEVPLPFDHDSLEKLRKSSSVLLFLGFDGSPDSCEMSFLWMLWLRCIGSYPEHC